MGNEKTPSVDRKHNIILYLHQTYFHTLMGLALYLTQDENEAEELLATTFSKICTWNIDRLEMIFNWNSASTYTYLSSTITNAHIDIQRKKKNQKELEKNYLKRIGLKYEHSPESIFLSDENIRIIKKAYYDTIANETKIVRVAFYLRTERGLKNKEIANQLEQSPNTIGTNFRRLRLKIKEKIS